MPKDHVVRQGECLNGIAARYGMLPDTIWNDPGNSALKGKRDDPDTLLPGDRLKIPDLKVGEVSASDAQRHRFKYKGKPLQVRVKVLKDPAPDPEKAEAGGGDYAYEDPVAKASKADPEPEADAPFVFNLDGALIEGTTDGDGIAEVKVPAGARRGRLTLHPGTPEARVIDLELGGLHPASEPSGVSQRLRNLGYPCPSTGKETPELAAALKTFQEQHGLKVSGKIDKATQDKLVEVHGV